MFCHDNLKSYYIVNFALTKFHGFALTELDNMIPWERMIYIRLIEQYLREEERKNQLEKNQNNARNR